MDIHNEGDAMFDGIKYDRMLLKHDGCVNTANWNDDGSLIVTGSDDLNIKVSVSLKITSLSPEGFVFFASLLLLL
jgi:WD40 repeat protein